MRVIQEYPLHLKPKDKIFIEGQPHTVHSASLVKSSYKRDEVSVETTTGCMLMLPINQMVEVHR